MRFLFFLLWNTMPATSLAQDAAGDDEIFADDQPYGIREAARDRRAITLGRGEGIRPAVVPDSHRVVSGDTLWDLCGYYYNNPYQWPRVWSFNAEITNPHWIYPGFLLRLRRAGGVSSSPGPTMNGAPALGRTAPETVFLRDRGFVDTESFGASGTVVGSPEEQMMLSVFDEVYVEFDDPRVVRIGQEYSVFQRVRGVPNEAGDESGVLVEFLGSVRVDSYDPDRRLARGVITEALNPIERGHRVAPIERRFDVVSPVRNQVDLVGRVMAGLAPADVLGEHHVVFVDRGAREGVQPGNRFFVVRQGDQYRRSLDEADDRSGYPFEVIAELRVVEARERTSTCLVIRSTREVGIGDRVEMRVGY